ncbi:hypothetical protein [Synechococcus sp. CCY 9618]|uniref:hypothetical protein n=1 Tax=Synechococcus sp. CCY 9618 TaxID=2815602 RepID=UPI001C24470A|nr:hypothetical protein [Synechococcus sp. CCY 9618]
MLLYCFAKHCKNMIITVISKERSGSTRFGQIFSEIGFTVYDEIFHPKTPWCLHKRDLALGSLKGIVFPREVVDAANESSDPLSMLPVESFFDGNPLRSGGIPVEFVSDLKALDGGPILITIFVGHLDAQTIADVCLISDHVLFLTRRPIDSYISMIKAMASGQFAAKGVNTTSLKPEIDPSKLIKYTDTLLLMNQSVLECLLRSGIRDSTWFVRYESWANFNNDMQVSFVCGFLHALGALPQSDYVSTLTESRAFTSQLTKQDAEKDWRNKISNPKEVDQYLQHMQHEALSLEANAIINLAKSVFSKKLPMSARR